MFYLYSSIGYPVVTLGFGFKSYVGFRIRQRKQKDVAKENDFYFQLLQEALPIDSSTQPSATTQTETVTQPVITNPKHNHKHHTTQHSEKWRTSSTEPASNTTSNSATISNGSITNHYLHQNGTIPHNTKNNHRKSVDKVNSSGDHANHLDKSTDINIYRKFIHLNGGTQITPVLETHECQTDNIDEHHHHHVHAEVEVVEKEKSSKTNIQKSSKCENKKENTQKKNKHKDCSADKENLSSSAEFVQKLEWDVKRLKSDLQSSRNSEQDLRSQISSISTTEKSLRLEVSQLQRDNEDLQNK